MLSSIKNGFIILTALLALSACADEKQQDESDEKSEQNIENIKESNGMDHSSMDHSSDGQTPHGLIEAANPKFPVGSKAIIQANHMEGMQGAEATVVGAYNTIVYTVSYTPKSGGEPVSNHKWVIHEEFEAPGAKRLQPGDKATINANHMEGMQGALATIDSANETTVYMVDYTANSGEQVTNHKWVTESELAEIAE